MEPSANEQAPLTNRDIRNAAAAVQAAIWIAIVGLLIGMLSSIDFDKGEAEGHASERSAGESHGH